MPALAEYYVTVRDQEDGSMHRCLVLRDAKRDWEKVSELLTQRGLTIVKRHRKLVNYKRLFCL